MSRGIVSSAHFFVQSLYNFKMDNEGRDMFDFYIQIKEITN